MAPIDRKLVRDLTRLRGQVITIALVVACGIASYVMLLGISVSLDRSRVLYYRRYRYAEVSAHLKRAPEGVVDTIRAIPGVMRVSTRVVESVMLPVASLPEPASATLVSIPDENSPELNDVYLRNGRLPERAYEVVLHETFAEAHGLKPGDRLPALFNGTRRELAVVGVGNSPEFLVVPRAPGELIYDPKRTAVVWMRRGAVASAFQMDGAFNDVCLSLQPGVDSGAVEEKLDDLLGRYGGLGAIGAHRQYSDGELSRLIKQFRSQATSLPLVFVGVAAFLLHVVLTRLVGQQRPEIATLKALGYRDRTIALHYLKLVSIIVLLGGVLGIGAGVWFGRFMLTFLGGFFRLPELSFQFQAQQALHAVMISLLAAVVGALGTAHHIAQLAPAEAMRPPTPKSYRPTVLERIGLFGLLGPTLRMVVREVERHPWRTLFSAVGIAIAVASLVYGLYPAEATANMVHVQMPRMRPEDLQVVFSEPRPARAIREIAHIPGVLQAEGIRMVPVRFRAGHRSRNSVVWGFSDQGGLGFRRVLDRYSREVPLPREGLLLTDVLAKYLDVGPGDRVEVELREGKRDTLSIPVVGLVDESFGLQGYTRLDALHAMLRESDEASMALLRIDSDAYEDVHRRLQSMPTIVSVVRPENAIKLFQQQFGNLVKGTGLVMSIFAAIIVVGVVYNNARVALAARSRDLASLRVLGFTRAEIASILVGELSIQVLLGIPIGLWIGKWLTGVLANPDPEGYRSPIAIPSHIYATSAMLALAAGAVSAWLVRHRLNRLDLIGVLKTRE